MKRSLGKLLTLLVLVSAGASAGCSEVRGRRLIQKANELYRDGQYPEAVAMFQQAEAFVPDLWLLWLNKGYTCRQMLTPGAKTAENEAATKCALHAFKRLQELNPADQRGPALYVQTLFEADQFEALATMYQERFRKNPRDEDALNGLVQVYSKWPDRMDQALEWYAKKAEVKHTDPEAQYALAVYIWQQLFAKGGGPDKATFDPRPDPNARRKDTKTPPPFASTDIVGARRIELADLGIEHLEKAVELRPKYHEAMTYLNLLYRQKSYAYFDKPEEWQRSIDKATEWRDKSLLSMGKPIPAPASSPGAAPSDTAAEAPVSPPPSAGALKAEADAPKAEAAAAAPAKAVKKPKKRVVSDPYGPY